MSNSSINKVKTKLWVKAGGRCEYSGCNIELWRDNLTMREMNNANIAHIVADSSDGPRGDSIMSKKLKSELSNLMLLCPTHHKKIDVDEVTEHSIERLQMMKKEHEDRIERVTHIKPEKKSEVIIYSANIGSHNPPINYNLAVNAMMPDWYPASSQGINLGMVNFKIEDDQEHYWTIQRENLEKSFKQQIKPLLDQNKLNHLSIFGFAPQPLLMLLGALITDIPVAETYQLHREPPDWKWQKHPKNFKYIINKPINKDGIPALVLSLSAVILPSRVTDILGKNVSIWEVSHSNPNNDFLKSKKQLQNFREVMRSLMDEIKRNHGENAVIHVFPATPLSIAIDLGRIIMPKADLKMKIYDENKNQPEKPFLYAFDLDAKSIFKE